ncbi:MAG TPA: hypothetical protein VNC50_15485, partial [Planctomycetia bacterium]|nr:hypothetical protein [Planctomycetia bacterium]
MTFGLLFAFASCAFHAGAPADNDDEALLSALRERGLDRLSEILCKRQLADPSLPASQRAPLAIGLAEMISRRACGERAAADRRRGFAEADALVESVLAKLDRLDVAAYRLRLRQWRIVLERGETLGDLAKAATEDGELRRDAAEQSKRAASEISLLAEEIRRRTNEMVGARGFTPLQKFDPEVRLAAGLAWSVAAPALEGAERDAAVESGEKFLKEFTRNFVAHPPTLEATLALAELYRLGKRYDEAFPLVDEFTRHLEITGAFRQRADLLAGRILLDQDRVELALGKLDVPPKNRLPGAEWELALFEALLRASKPEYNAPKERQDRALKLLEEIESKRGGYWRIRGEQALAKYGEGELLKENPSALRRAANVQRAGKEYAKAIELLDRAVAAASKQKSDDLEMQLRIDAAGAAMEKGDYSDSGRRYLAAAERVGGAE